MMQNVKMNLVLIMAVLALSLSACAPSAPITAPAVDAPLILVEPTAAETSPASTKIATLQTAASVSTPTESPRQPTTTQEISGVVFDEQKLKGGYILFDREQGQFLTYTRDGSLLYSNPAPGIQYPNPWSMSIVHNAVYYQADESKNIYRSSAQGVDETTIPSANLTDFSVSPDEQWAAWSTMDPKSGVTEFWMGRLDGSSATRIGSMEPKGPVETLYYFLIGWTADGRLLFDYMPTGLGGYIPYMGNVNLFSYDPNNGQIEEIYAVPESEGPGRLCVESLREDLHKLVLNCDGDQRLMTILNLEDQSKVSLPALPGQGLAGSGQFSPSGKWLAYAIAEGNWENENGKVVVVPADMSQAPKVVSEVAGKSYPYVVGWLDDDTILFTRNQETETTLWKIGANGEELTQLGKGIWIGWIP